MLLVIAALAGCVSAGPPALGHGTLYEAIGRESLVELVSLQLPDAARRRDVPLRVSFPRDGARLPVIVFSHGNYASKDDYGPITDYWSAHGYVVVAITHPDSTALGAVRGKPTPNALPERLQDVQLVLARLEEIAQRIPALAGRIDAERIAIAGHSFGGLVAQAFAGMELVSPDGGSPVAMRRDPRIRAAVVFSGVGPIPPFSTPAGFATIRTPLLVTVGTEDLAMPNVPGKTGYALRREPFDLAPPGDKYLLVLNGADHYLGGMVGRDDLPRSPRGPDYVRVFDEVTLAFLDAYLSGREAARRELTQLAKPGRDPQGLFEFYAR